MNYSVYCHTFPNNKKYIGITCNNPKKRWRNGYGYKQHTILFNAIKKYGWESVTHDILYTCLSKEEASNIEIKLIKDFNLQNIKNGYNVNDGGNIISEESRKKISVALKGRIFSEQHKEKISKAKKGKAIFKKGTKFSEEHKNNISKSKLGKKMSYDTKKKLGKKVIQISLKNEIVNKYNTIMEIEKEGIANHSSVIRVCMNKQQTAGGFRWKYDE